MDERVNKLVNEYCQLRDRQFAVYHKYAKNRNISTYELFVLDILWFDDGSITQKGICDRLSVNKQTIASIISKFKKQGYAESRTSEDDARNKIVVLTESGKKYAEGIIPRAALAENIAMDKLGLGKLEQLIGMTLTLTENMEEEFKKLEEE